MPLFQHLKRVIERHAGIRQQHHHMEQQVCRLVGDFTVVILHAGERQLDPLLTDFLGNPCLPLGKQRCCVASLRHFFLAGLYKDVEMRKEPGARWQPVTETGARTRVAGRPRGKLLQEF